MSIARHLRLAAQVAVCLLASGVAPRSVYAQTAETGPTKAERATARDAYDQGTTSFEHGDFVTALDSFVKANALIPSVQAMFWIAQSQDKLGHVEAAIEAYEAVTARGDFAKLSDEKAATVRDRLAALKAQLAPPASPAPVSPGPSVTAPSDPGPSEPATPAPPPPNVTEPPAANEEGTDELRPNANSVELGILGGLLFVSDSHNLVKQGHKQRPFASPVGQVGVRAAFFPFQFLGVEGEWAHGFGQEADVNQASGSSAHFDALRGHVIGQLPSSRFVPFALLGAGLLHARSHQNGADTDLLLEAGVGLKVMATKLLVPRCDFRLNMTQKKGGGLGDGVAVHPEILLGLGFVFGG